MIRLKTILGYLLAAALMLGPVLLHPTQATVGIPGVDAQDTVMLRGLVADALSHPGAGGLSQEIYWPVGFQVLGLTPNLLDHISAMPLVLALPFPLADNLWWLGVLALNGLCAHRLGRQVGGSEAAGWLVGLAWMLSEPITREANLHHAPQAMAFWAPLFLAELLALRANGGARRAALAGLWLGLAAQSYWYYGLFLGLGASVLLVGGGGEDRAVARRDLAILIGTSALVCLPTLAPLLAGWGSDPITAGGKVPPPQGLPASYDAVDASVRFVAQHGNDLLFWWNRAPMDTSNRVSLALLAAAVLGARGLGRWTRLGLLSMSALGAVMVLGPYLRAGDGLALWNGDAVSLPFRWFGSLHPFLARLTWPERWGLLIPLGLLPLAARAPRPLAWTLAIAVESLLLSKNLPLQTYDLQYQSCYAALDEGSGAILELPLVREGLLAPRVGVHARFHRHPTVNPILLPPGARPPEAWRTWSDGQPLISFILKFESGRWPDEPGAEAVRALVADGVTTLVVDAEPDAVLTEGGLRRYQTGLTRLLGPPIDIGCALVWPLSPDAPHPAPVDGLAWRKAARRAMKQHPKPALPALMAPTGPEQASGAP